MNDKEVVELLLKQIRENMTEITNVEITQWLDKGTHETIIEFTIDRNVGKTQRRDK